ncbi:MAG: GAF domain-containing protein [Actinobacteria bacterium]|nr:GAF domain-containing protein [Actinomycetota bacterium]
MGLPLASKVTSELMSAILDLAGDLDAPSLLERFVAASTALTGARYGAINIVDAAGLSTTFVHSGMDPHDVAVLGRPPRAHGVLGDIPDEGVLRLADLREHPAYRGLPAGHPPMGSFLGTSVRVRGERYGALYLAEKDGGFDEQDEQVVRALAAAAAVAVQNAELYALERRRRQWQGAGQAVTTMLLEGADQEDVLERIATAARGIDGAETAALALPGSDFELLLEIVTGAGQQELLGLDVSADIDVRSAFETGTGHTVASMVTSARGPFDRHGPALFAPMLAEGESIGVLLLLRPPGAPPFTADDLAMSQSFASQAALAFVLAEAQQLRGQAVLHDERSRIARDLHDMAIQQLFAAGMTIEAARQSADPVPPALDAALEAAVGHVDAGIRQIRVIVRTLDDPGATTPLVDRVLAEATLARGSLGFAPELTMSVDGVPVGSDPAVGLRIDDLVAPGRANNVVAVVREGLSNVARHARSRSVAVRLLVTSGAHGSITVEVEDDGVGMPPARTRASGTKNLAHRAEESGGTFALLKAPSGRGALLRWTAALD